MTLARRNLPAIRNAEMGSASFIPHLDLEAVLQLIQAATGAHPRTGERDGLLIAPALRRLLAGVGGHPPKAPGLGQDRRQRLGGHGDRQRQQNRPGGP